MNDKKQIKETILDDLKQILNISYPHCEENNTCSNDFIVINKKAHEILKKIEKLSI